MGQIRRALAQAKPSDAGPDRAAAHEHDVPPLVHQADKLLGDRRHPVVIERAVFMCEHARADFDDDGLRASGNFLANGIEHGRKLRREPACWLSSSQQANIAVYAGSSTRISTPVTRSFTVSR